MKINNKNIQIDKGDMVYIWDASLTADLDVLADLYAKDQLAEHALEVYDLTDGQRYYAEYPDAAIVDYIDSQLYDVKHMHVVSQAGTTLLLEDGSTFTIEENLTVVRNQAGCFDVRHRTWLDETTLESIDILVVKK